MNLREFSALKVGDEIENASTGSHGAVVEAKDSGVRIVWGPRSATEHPFFYSVMSTAWMQWTLKTPEVAAPPLAPE